MSEFERPRATDLVASRFTLGMNAATSRFGFLCDIPTVFVILAVVVAITAGTYQVFPTLPPWGAIIPVALPLTIFGAVHLSLLNARRQVLRWIESIPFPIDNLNAVLSGSGEFFEIYFKHENPSREVLMNFFERASDEAFVIEHDEDIKSVTARFGVTESKLNPYLEAHRRYARMQRLVERALVPLHDQHPVDRVLIL